MDKPNEHEPVKRVTAAEARALLIEQKTSGLSVAAFARQKSVPSWSLYNAIAIARRRARRKAEKHFAEVNIIENEPLPEPPQNALIELALPSGISLRVGAGFDEVTLRRLLGMLATC